MTNALAAVLTGLRKFEHREFPLPARKMRVLGREIDDGNDVVHVSLNMTKPR
jgi:hypothetical protein